MIPEVAWQGHLKQKKTTCNSQESFAIDCQPVRAGTLHLFGDTDFGAQISLWPWLKINAETDRD